MSNDHMNDLITEALRWANGHPNRRSSELMRALADALEAATREPSGDGEYLLSVIETIKQTGGSVEIHGVKIMPCDEFGRTAAVPDAATEELLPDEMTANEAIGLVLKRPGMYGLVPLGEHRSVKAERDAALAAVERVRAEADAYAEQPDVMEPCGAVAQAIRAALDWAPEPEVKP